MAATREMKRKKPWQPYDYVLVFKCFYASSWHFLTHLNAYVYCRSVFVIYVWAWMSERRIYLKSGCWSGGVGRHFGSSDSFQEMLESSSEGLEAVRGVHVCVCVVGTKGTIH